MAAKLIARPGDGNAVTAGLAVQVRRSDTVVDHIVFNADGTTTLPSFAADPAAPTTGSIWFRSDIGTIRASGDLAATGVLKAQGGLQFGGAASRGLYADHYNFAIRTPGTGYVYIQTEGGTSNYAVFGPTNSLFNPTTIISGGGAPSTLPTGSYTTLIGSDNNSSGSNGLYIFNTWRASDSTIIRVGSNNSTTTPVVADYFLVRGDGLIVLPNSVPNAASDSAASSAGVPVGGIYRNGSQLMIRVN